MATKKIEQLTELAGMPGLDDYFAVAQDTGGGVYQTRKVKRKNALRQAELTELLTPGVTETIMVEKLVGGVPTLYKAQIGNLPFTVRGGIRWVDATYGNDATGTPFKTPTAAKAAAAAGETIIVGPGVYNDKDLLKHNVNWLFLPGAKLRYTGSSGYLFSDNGSAVTASIQGWGIFEYAGTDLSASGVMRVSNVSTVVKFQFDECEANGAFVFNVTLGVVYPKGNKAHSDGTTAINVVNGLCHWDIGEVNGVVSIANLNATPLMKCKGGRIYLPSGSDQVALTITGGRIDLRIDEIAGDVYGIYCDESTGVADVRCYGTTFRNWAPGGGVGAIWLGAHPTRFILDGCKVITNGDYAIGSDGVAANVRIYAQTLSNKNAHTSASGGLIGFYIGGSRFEVDTDLI